MITRLLNVYKNGGTCIFVFYWVYYSAMAPFSSFLTVYYSDCGLSSSQIGVLSAIGPVITVIGQFFWGNVADKARYKNYVLITLAAITAVMVYCYSLGITYSYFLIITCFYTFFQCSIQNIGDAISLAHAERTGKSYALMRLGGSIGYAIMALISGFIIAGKTRLIFPLSITMFLTLAVAIALMPLIKGGRNKNEDGKKANYLTLFKNRSLVVILFFNFLVYAPYFFYAIFIGVRMREVGATNQMIGLANFLAAFCEIPFLFLADRLLQKYGFKPLLLIAGSTMALRLFLSGIIESAWILVFIHMLHGTGHIIASYCTSRYINTTVPNELKASGQTLLGMVTYGLAKMIASLLGGYAVDWIGILSFSPPVMSPLFITLPTSELSPLLALSDLQAKSAGNILSASMVIRNLRQSFITF